MQTVPLFDHSLYAIEFENHKENKEKALKVIHDISQKSINCNNMHHAQVHQTVPGLQMNNAFKYVVKSQGLGQFAQQMHRNIGLPAERDLQVVNMCAYIVPPGAQLKMHDQYGFYSANYFIHSPANSGMFIIDSNIHCRFFELVGVTEQNEWNSHTRAFNMPESGCYIVPSHLKVGTTTNNSDDTAVILQFVLDVVEK